MLRRLLLLALCAAAAPALAQVDPEIVRSTAGIWFLSDMATGKGCNLTLSVDDTIGGHVVEGPAGCTVGGMPAEDLAAWNFDGEGGIILIDPLRKVRFRLKEQEYGDWTSEGPEGSFALTPSEAGVMALPFARDAFGRWVLRRPDGPVLCTVNLADGPPPGGEESFALSVGQPCDAAVASLKLVSWRIEGVSLVLYGEEGRSLAFLADGSGGYAKAPREGGRPLVMLRAP